MGRYSPAVAGLSIELLPDG